MGGQRHDAVAFAGVMPAGQVRDAVAAGPVHDVRVLAVARGRIERGGQVLLDAEERREHLAHRLAESLGGVESLIEHPGRMTHASVAGSRLEVPPTLVRLSVGIEHPDDWMLPVHPVYPDETEDETLTAPEHELATLQ